MNEIIEDFIKIRKGETSYNAYKKAMKILSKFVLQNSRCLRIQNKIIIRMEATINEKI